MNVFHIDFNTHHFTRGYLERWLRELSEMGFDAVLWEIENAVDLDTLPGCAAPEAFSKEEFRSILDYSRSLGLEAIPLLQTLGHVEYILKHREYRHLSEHRNDFRQFCPLNPKVAPFIHRVMDEYLDLFGEVRIFHVGADESWWLGQCPKCREFVRKRSKSELYVRHVNKVVKPLLEKGIVPAIWSDMVLSHPEALGRLSRDVMQFDWNYWGYEGCSDVWVWGENRSLLEDTPADTLERFRRFLFPRGDEPGMEPEQFYTADFLKAEGFRVVLCPSSSSSGDSVFAPRTRLHLANTLSAFRKAQKAGLEGAALTSWTVRINPWECQAPVMEVPAFLKLRPAGSLEEFERWFAWKRFGTEDTSFFRGAGLLSKPVLFSKSQDLGIDKTVPNVPKDHVLKHLRSFEPSDAERELEEASSRLSEYRAARKILVSFKKKIRKGASWLEPWEWAARNLQHRAGTACVLLRWRIEGLRAPSRKTREEARRLLRSLPRLRKETDTFFRRFLKPSRAAVETRWLYDSVEFALRKCAGTAP